MTAAGVRMRLLEDALRDLAQTHGLDALLVDPVPIGTRAVVRDAVNRSARRADAIAAAHAEAAR